MTLRLFNSLTRQLEDFEPVHDGEARVYTCGPTVYNYPHIGNMRAYVFADTLGRALTFKGYKLRHVINITDVGHLTDDGDAGEDKLEKAAAANAQSIWDIARHYTESYWADFRALNCNQPAIWSIATDYVPQMIDFAKSIADRHCYELDSGLYFDTSTVANYGSLARAVTDDGEGRIAAVDGKRHAADFAIWRKTPPGETRQMEWESPWGKGAPGWHLECSVMSEALLGLPFDIHTGGIDHREIHHPNEIAQNQAHSCSDHSGARIWMHNNFLIDRTKSKESGKMSKSSGEFLRLQTLVDRGFHPLAYRMMCLQAHYRSEMEFTWEGLAAAFVRLKRIVMGVERLRHPIENEQKDGGPTVSEAIQFFKDRLVFSDYRDKFIDDLFRPNYSMDQYQHQVRNMYRNIIFDDLHTPGLLASLELMLQEKQRSAELLKLIFLTEYDAVLGFGLLNLSRADLRIRPASATLTEPEIETRLDERKAARAAKDFATSDRIRDDLIAQGVEVMDGDPLGWDWKLDI